MTTVITEFSAHIIIMFLVTFNHNAPCPLSSQCSMLWSSPCSMPLSSQCYMTPFLTMLNGPCHHNAPLPLSSQWSRTTFITMLHDTFHHMSWRLTSMSSGKRWTSYAPRRVRARGCRQGAGRTLALPWSSGRPSPWDSSADVTLYVATPSVSVSIIKPQALGA